MSKKIGELLLDYKLLDQAQLDQVIAEQKKTGDKIGDIIIRRGLVSAEDLETVLSRQHNVPSVNLENFVPSPKALSLIPERYMREHQLVPLEIKDKTLSVAMLNPRDFRVIDELRFMAGMKVSIAVAASFEIRRALDRAFAQVKEGALAAGSSAKAAQREADLADAVEWAGAASVPEGLDILLASAINVKASHLHVHLGDGPGAVRFRIGGKLTVRFEVLSRSLENIVKRLKLLCGLTEEKRKTSTSYFDAKVGTSSWRIGLSLLPTEDGESAVISFAPAPLHSAMTLDILGMYPDTLKTYRKMAGADQGLLLFAAPGESGATTTMYATLAHLHAVNKRFVTIESPVRRRIEGVEQIDPARVPGLDELSVLNSLLSQDVDCMMVEGLQNPDMLTTAMRAARSGSMVLGRADFTGGPVQFLSRAVGMGVSMPVLASALTGLVGQRLVDMLCASCIKSAAPPAQISAELKTLTGRRAPHVYSASGCSKCSGTGKMGKVGLFEVIPMTEALRGLIADRAPEARITEHLTNAGVATIRQDALLKAADGLISLEDALANL